MTDVLNEQSNTDDVLARGIQNELERLKGARDLKDRRKAALDEIEELDRSIRDGLIEIMHEAGVVTCKGSGLQVTRKTRKNHVILDQLALTEALDKLGILPDYLRLDTRPAAKFGAENGLPGVAFDEITYLSISEVKS